MTNLLACAKNAGQGMTSDIMTSFGLTLSNEIGDRTFIICAILCSTRDFNIFLVTLVSILAILLVNLLAIGIVLLCMNTGIASYFNGTSAIVLRICGFGFVLMGLYTLFTKLKEKSTNTGTIKHPYDIKHPLIQKSRSLSTASSNWTTRKSFTIHNPQTETATSRRVSRMEETIEIETELKSIENGTAMHLVKKVFPMIFLSEIGDKSMVTTIFLASTYGPLPVAVGASLGIATCIIIAAFLGRFSSAYISSSSLDYISGLIMLIIGVVMMSGVDV